MSEILKSGLSKLITSGKEYVVGAVEIIQFPEEYFSEGQDESSHRPFYNILRVLNLFNVPGAIRYQRIHRQTRILYLTWTHEESELHENIESLVDAVKGTLPEFKFKIHSRFQGPVISESLVVVRSHLIGEPLSIEDQKQHKDVMNTATELLQGMSDGIIQVSFIPKRPNERTRKSLENKYRDEMEQAQRTVSSSKSTLFSGEVQESVTKYDKRAEQRAESLQIQITRMSQSRLCEVSVTTICWSQSKKSAERNTKKLIDAIRGPLFPADPRKELSIQTKKVKPTELTKVMQGVPIGKFTILSLDEACVYLPLPRGDLGVPVADHATFHSNPADLKPNEPHTREDQPSEDVLIVGKVLDDSGRPIRDFVIPIDDLPSHLGLSGDTGRGKTTTQINILLELYVKKKNFLVLLASKNEEYVRLIRTIESIRVFTLGDETTTPVRFSLTGYGEGVHVNSIINDIKTAFVAMMPTHGMIKEYLEALIELTFERLGWDRDTNTRGLPLLLSDFLETLPLMEEDLQYSVRGNEDFRGALFGRLRALSKGSLSRVFGTISGMTIAELVATPSVFLLDKLSKEERAFFVYWLVSNLGRFYEARKKLDSVVKKGLKFYVVMEEAHRFLTGGTGIKVDEDHGAQRAAIDTISTSMKESRSSGLGYGLATQKPSHLNNEAFTMALTNIVHTTGSKNDRQLIGDLMNCTDDQIRMMGSLPIGEAVIRTASVGKPVRVRINNPLSLHPELADDKPVTDEDLRKHMEAIYEQYPHFEARIDTMLELPKLEELDKEIVSIRIDMQKILKLYSMLDTASFKGAYNGMIEAAKSGNALIGGLVIKHLGILVANDDRSGSFYCQHLVWLLSRTSGFRDVKDQIISELNSILKTPLKNLDTLHERLFKESRPRMHLHEENEKVLRNEIKEAVGRAIEELRSLPKSIPSSTQPPSHGDRLDHLIPAVVQTEQFSSRYLERVNKAAKGDLKPIARMIRVFAKNIVESEDDLEDVALRLVTHARIALQTPEDDGLWNSITKSVRHETNSQGSEGVG